MFKKITITSDYNRKQEKQEKEFPFKLGKMEIRTDASWENLTLNNCVEMCRSRKVDLKSQFEIYKGKEKIEIDYSKPYLEVLELLSSQVYEIKYFVEKIETEKETIYKTNLVVVNLEKTW